MVARICEVKSTGDDVAGLGAVCPGSGKMTAGLAFRTLVAVSDFVRINAGSRLDTVIEASASGAAVAYEATKTGTRGSCSATVDERALFSAFPERRAAASSKLEAPATAGLRCVISFLVLGGEMMICLLTRVSFAISLKPIEILPRKASFFQLIGFRVALCSWKTSSQAVRNSGVIQNN